jgi:hypothetical protein
MTSRVWGPGCLIASHLPARRPRERRGEFHVTGSRFTRILCARISEHIGESTALLYNVPRSRSLEAAVAGDRWRFHPRCST